jgi:hypothetical protein
MVTVGAVVGAVVAAVVGAGEGVVVGVAPSSSFFAHPVKSVINSINVNRVTFTFINNPPWEFRIVTLITRIIPRNLKSIQNRRKKTKVF